MSNQSEISPSNVERQSPIKLDSTSQSKRTVLNDYISSNSIGKIKRRYILTISLISLIGFSVAIFEVLIGAVSYLDIGLFAIMSFMTGSSITVGFHRHFAHKTFETKPIVRLLLAIFGSMAAQGSIIAWVSIHRCHHQYTDKIGDPHSPNLHGKGIKGNLQGLWFAYIGWMFDDRLPNYLVFAKDMLRDPAIYEINRLYFLLIFLGLVIPAIIGGFLTWSWRGAFQGFIWGGVARMFYTFNAGYIINSITHAWGTRMFQSADRSTNSIWLAIPTFGEAWHNNHHAFPGSAKFGWKWWQIDIGYWVIRGLELLGLAWDVKLPNATSIEAKKLASAD